MSEKIHIMHIIDSLAPGGAERMVVEIANATDTGNYQVSICITRCDDNLVTHLSHDVNLFRLERTRRFEFEKFNKFYEYCKKNEVNLFHVHGRTSLRFIAFMHLFKNILKEKSIIFHDHYGDIEINPNFPFSAKIAIKITKPIYVGVHEKLSAVAIKCGIKREKIFTIRNAISFEPYLTPSKVPANLPKDFRHKKRPYGILVSNIRMSKDIILLLRALGKIKHYNWTFAIVGGFQDPVYLEKCLSLMKELKLEERVFFFNSRLDVVDIIKHADFGALSSKSESGPLVLIEYLAAGLPFVSTRVGLIGRYLESLGIPEFVAAGDCDSFAAGLKRLLLLTDRERRKRGVLGKKKAADHFDICNVMPLWEEIYKKALAISL